MCRLDCDMSEIGDSQIAQKAAKKLAQTTICIVLHCVLTSED